MIMHDKMHKNCKLLHMNSHFLSFETYTDYTYSQNSSLGIYQNFFAQGLVSSKAVMKLGNWRHSKSDHHEDLCAPNQQPEQLDNLTRKKKDFKSENISFETIYLWRKLRWLDWIFQ